MCSAFFWTSVPSRIRTRPDIVTYCLLVLFFVAYRHTLLFLFLVVVPYRFKLSWLLLSLSARVKLRISDRMCNVYLINQSISFISGNTAHKN